MGESHGARRGPERRGWHGIGDQRRAAANRSSIVNLSGAAHGDQADRMACSRVGNLAARERDRYPLVER